MNKKQLMTLVNSLVARVQEHDSTLEEAEARTLVGIALRQHSDSIVAKCVGLVEPSWGDYRDDLYKEEVKTIAELEDEQTAIYDQVAS